MAARTIYLMAIAVLLAGCAVKGGAPEQGAQPDWVMGISAQYPKGVYLCGVGEGDTLTDAKSRARAEVAKIFNVAVQETSIENASFSSSSFGDDGETTESLTIDREIRTSTQQVLAGVELPEVWQDPVTHRYYALAVLPRLKTAASLRSEVDQLDAATAAQIEQAHATDSLFRKIRFAERALELQAKRRVLARQLKVVSPVGQVTDTPWSLEKLRADRDALIARVSIKPRADGDFADELQRALANVLAAQGYDVGPEGRYEALLTLTSTQLPAAQDRWYLQKALLVLSVTGEGGAYLGGYEWHFQVSATKPSLADIRVLEQANVIIRAELNDRLLATLTAEGEAFPTKGI